MTLPEERLLRLAAWLPNLTFAAITLVLVRLQPDATCWSG
jgi:hypothetical protein